MPTWLATPVDISTTAGHDDLFDTLDLGSHFGADAGDVAGACFEIRNANTGTDYEAWLRHPDDSTYTLSSKRFVRDGFTEKWCAIKTATDEVAIAMDAASSSANRSPDGSRNELVSVRARSSSVSSAAIRVGLTCAGSTRFR